MININFEKVLQKIGGVALDTTSYDSIRETWDSQLSTSPRCPSPRVFTQTWLEMVFSGEETGDWKQERQKAYQNQAIFIEKINDLIMEYNLAIANGDTTTANKYKTELSTLQDKRKVIKQQFPKP